MFLNQSGDMYVFGTSNEGKLGIFRLDERMIGRGQSDQGYYTIDWPWKLTEEIPHKWAMSQDLSDIFNQFTDFSSIYTSQGLLRKERSDRIIVQVVCSDYNTYFVYRDGRVLGCGANTIWQCSEIESMKIEINDCVAPKHLMLNSDEEKRLEAAQNGAQ